MTSEMTKIDVRYYVRWNTQIPCICPFSLADTDAYPLIMTIAQKKGKAFPHCRIKYYYIIAKKDNY